MERFDARLQLSQKLRVPARFFQGQAPSGGGVALAAAALANSMLALEQMRQAVGTRSLPWRGNHGKFPQRLSFWENGTRGTLMSAPMPAIFFGHGNPLNANRRNGYTRQWEAVGANLPRPKAILSISSHWLIEEVAVTVSSTPKMIHDVGGFLKELYQLQYPVSGDPQLAARVAEILAPLPVRFDEKWGIDHGTWSVLRHVYPKADVPVVQLSIDATQPPAFHFELGRRLAPLREEGVLIMGSGNVVHNLQAFAWRAPSAGPYEWAVAFEQRVKEMLLADQSAALIDYQRHLGQDALLAVPTPDHYLPLLYIIGARRPAERVSFPVEGFDGGSISMLAVQVG